MQNLFKLTENADELLRSDKQISNGILLQLKNIVNNKQFIGIAQINTISGDFESNAKKIAKYIKFAENIGLEAVVFPEFSLSGLLTGDILDRHPDVVNENIKWLNGLAKITKNTIAFVGFIEQSNIPSEYYSSIAILNHEKICNIIRKSSPLKISNCNLKKDNNDNLNSIFSGYKIIINDDILDNNKNNSEKIDILINPSVDTYKESMANFSSNILSDKALSYELPLIYVNQVGGNDNILLDGISQVYNKEGKLIARAKYLEEQFMIVNPSQNIGKIYPLTEHFENCITPKDSFSLNYEDDLERIYNSLVMGVKDYFKKCGLKRAVLGLSGGLDSTVCAVILADALGKENVFGISMPSHITSSESQSDAEKLANNLGINFAEAPIRNMINTTTDSFNKLFEKIQNPWSDRYEKSFTPDNIQARSRAMYLWGVSNEFPNCIPIATSDKSEAYMGYATINGDMSGGFAPIADITKTKLFALARWLNKNRSDKNVIPESIINKRPGAELAIDPKTGKPLIAEDALMPYEFLDEIIWRIENNHETYHEMLNSQFIFERKNNISQEQKIEWLDKFYKRMSSALYKWSIMPPYVMVEPHSINKCDYYQPITTSRINYKGVSKEYINLCLK